MALAVVSPTRNRGSRAQTPIFIMGNQYFWVQMAQAWLGPAEARPGARFWKSGNLEIQKFGIQRITQIRNLKIQIRSAQNVGQVWISRKKSSWPHWGPSETIFSMDQKNAKMYKICLLSLVGQWVLFTRFGPMGPIHPVWSHVLVSFEE